MSAPRNRLVHLLPLAAIQVVGLACGLIGVRWSSAIVLPEAMGIYGLLLSAQQMATAVTHQGFIKHVQRFWTPRTPAGPYVRLLLAASGWPLAWLAGGLALVMIFFRVSAGFSFSLDWWAWLIAVNVLAVASAAAQAALQAEEKYWTGFFVATIGAATRSFLPPLMVVLGGSTVLMLGTGYFLHAVVFTVAAVWALHAAWRRVATPGAEAVEAPQKMVRAFLGAGLFGWIAAAAPRWFAAQALTPEATGYFMLAANLAMIVPAAASLIGQNYSFPALFAASRDGAANATLFQITNRTVAAVMLVTQAGLLVLAWCGPRLVGVLVDPRYAPAMGWILAAGGGILATLTAPLFCNLLIARNREAACVWLTAASGIFRVAILAALAAAKPEWFRAGLVWLPWPTVALEWWLTRRWLARAQ